MNAAKKSYTMIRQGRRSRELLSVKLIGRSEFFFWIFLIIFGSLFCFEFSTIISISKLNPACFYFILEKDI